MVGLCVVVYLVFVVVFCVICLFGCFVLAWFVSSACSFIITPSIFSNVYLIVGCMDLTCFLIYFTACSNHLFSVHAYHDEQHGTHQENDNGQDQICDSIGTENIDLIEY
jgi:hypothetical protein